MSISKIAIGLTAVVTIALIGITDFRTPIAQALSTASGALPQIFAAQANAADLDFHTIGTIQNVSIQVNNAYAPSIDSLRDGSLTYALPTTNGRGLSYTLSADGAHYIVAEQLPNSFRVASDTAAPITCTNYTATCLARVTADPSLIASTPNWVTF